VALVERLGSRRVHRKEEKALRSTSIAACLFWNADPLFSANRQSRVLRC